MLLYVNKMYLYNSTMKLAFPSLIWPIFEVFSLNCVAPLRDFLAAAFSAAFISLASCFLRLLSATCCAFSSFNTALSALDEFFFCDIVYHCRMTCERMHIRSVRSREVVECRYRKIIASTELRSRGFPFSDLIPQPPLFLCC